MSSFEERFNQHLKSGEWNREVAGTISKIKQVRLYRKPHWRHWRERRVSALSISLMIETESGTEPYIFVLERDFTEYNLEKIYHNSELVYKKDLSQMFHRKLVEKLMERIKVRLELMPVPLCPEVCPECKEAINLEKGLCLCCGWEIKR